jgi:phosphate transport system protein
MSAHLHHEIDHLKQELLRMAGFAEAAVHRAMQALEKRDPDLAQRVKDDDDALDRLEMDIDELAIQLLAKAPLASDLRLITAAMKISRDLERVGDEATTIARRAIDLTTEPPLTLPQELSHLLNLALAMLAAALDAFVNQDPISARTVPPRDKEADRLHKQIQAEMIQLMLRDPGTITRAMRLIVTSKSLERIADHAVNIAEDVVYLCEALDIRHAGQEVSPLREADAWGTGPPPAHATPPPFPRPRRTRPFG